jgi:RNA polymerase sigma-70 factor (ECF subfamily)
MILRLASVPTMDPAPTSDGEDPASLAVNRRQRVDRLVRDHLDFVWRLLRRLGLPAAAADDAAQQVFVVAARRVDDIAADSERSFLYGAALRVLQEYRRGAARRRETMAGDALTEQRDSRPGPDELVDLKRAAELLDRVLQEMTDDLRTAFVLFELEGLTTPEIAAVVGVPLGTAASRLRRARQQFSSALERLRTQPTPRSVP